MFKINCVGMVCTQQNNIYYHTRATLDWSSPYYSEVWAGSGVVGGTSLKVHVACGAGYSGSCSMETWGVVPGSAINADPSRDFHIEAYAGWDGIYIGSGDWETKDFFAEVSLDPSLISGLPEDMILCGGCGQEAINHVGDPINTRTGAMSYPVDDLAIMSSAGPLAFQRTYSSAALDIYGTSLGYGWTHNHDMHLVFPTDPGGIPGFVKLRISAEIYTGFMMSEM